MPPPHSRHEGDDLESDSTSMRAVSESDLDMDDFTKLQTQETRDGHLYDGYPDYHMSTASQTTSRRNRTANNAENLIRRITTGLPAPETFQHPLAEKKTNTDCIVEFEGPDDPYRPINWPVKKRVRITLLYGLTTLGASWGSSIFSSVVPRISEEFHVANVVSVLGISLYLFGLGTGPLIWAPLSELYGRKTVVMVPYFIGAMFAFGTATAKDIQTVMITRFFCGFFSASPLTNTGGVLGDLWKPEQRGAAMAGYSMAVVGGPLLAPIVGGAIVDSSISWRWTEYITGMLMLFFLVLDLFFIDESYAPVLLVYKARTLRHETGNWALHAKHEEWDVSISSLANKYLVRPFQLLSTPIAACMATYASFVYGILYLCFAAFPIEFQQERGWNALVGSLPFIGVLIGCILAAAINSLNTSYYAKRVKANGGRPVPEARLPPMMLGAILFPTGCFIFAWTSNKDIPWIAPVIGASLLGLGFLTIFQCALNYLIDTFQTTAASAVAGNTALRSVFAGVFPIFTSYMYNAMGIEWATSLIGFVAVAMIPIPFLFFIYGKRIRAKSKWSRASV